MNKKVRYAINGGIFGGVGLAFLNTLDQLDESNRGVPFDWKSLFISFLKGAGIGAAAGLAVGAVCDYHNSRVVPIDTDRALLSLLNKVRLTPTDSIYKQLRTKSEWLIELLNDEYRGYLKKVPFRFGSTENGTALSENFDIDIWIAFKPGVFSSAKEMYLSLLDCLAKYNGVNGIIKIREQRKSIGIFFTINGIEQKIDILPQKLSKGRGNSTSGYLYVNNKGLLSKPSRTKTDIRQLNSISLNETQKKILIVLKKWKTNENVPISSHFLQYLLLDAYEYNEGYIPRRFTDKILMVFTHVMDNIEFVRINSVENTNNVLSDIPNESKVKIKDSCKRVISEYEYQPNSIIRLLES